MAEGFSQRISLEGAQEILRQLEAIGAGGTKAFRELQVAASATSPALNAVSAASKAAQTGIAGLGTAATQAASLLAPFNSSLTGLLGTFTSFASLGPLAAVGGLVAFIKSAAESTTLDRQAKALGLTALEYQGLAKAMKAAGLSSEELNTGVTRLNTSIAGAAGEQFKALIDLAKKFSESFTASPIRLINVDQTLGDIARLRAAIAEVAPQLKAVFQDTGNVLGNLPIGQFEQTISRIAVKTDAAGAEMRKLINEASNFATAITPFERLDQLVVKNAAGIKSLGVSFLDSKGQMIGSLDAILKLADQLNKLPDGFLKTATAAKLAGRGVGPELFAALSQGRAGIDGIISALEKQGIALDRDLIQKAKEARAAFLELEGSASRVGNELLSAFGPVLTHGLKSTADEIKNIRAVLKLDFGFFQLAPGVEQAAIGQMRAIIEQIKKMFEELPPSAQAVGEKIGSSLVTGLRSALPTITTVVDAVRGIFKKAGEGGGEAPGDEGGVFGPLDPVRTIKGVEQLKNGVGILRLGLTEANQAAKDAAQAIVTGMDAGKASTDRLTGSVRNANAALELLKKPIKDLTDIQFTELFNFKGGGQERAGRDFAVNPFIADLERAAAAMQAFKDKLEQSQGGGGGGAGGGGSAQLQRISEDATTAKTKVAELGDTTTQLASTFASIPSGAFDPVTTSADGAQTSVAAVGTTFQEVGALLSGPVEGSGEGVKVVFEQIGNEAEQTLATTRELASALQQAASIDVSVGGDGGSLGAAGGGYIRGPGTATSDSILARLSNGEYVVQAPAVAALIREYGSGIMSWINRGRLPHFSLGGYVDSLTDTLASSLALPRFAAGGMAGGGALHPVALSINGGQVVHVKASSNAVEQMRRAAVNAQITSMGKRSRAWG